MDAVTIKNLCFSYGKDIKPVIRGCNLSIPTGSVTAVLGPNGAGKTTLLYLMLGLLKPVSGNISFFGKPQKTYTEKNLKQILGMVAQNEFIPFDLNVMEYVLLGRAPHLGLLQHPGPDDIRLAEDAVATVGLEQFSDRAVPSLSSGEKQMASVARLLAQAPTIMLFDEPTSHLDLANSRRILTRMKDMAADKKTVLFTTHDPNAALVMADYVVLLGKERVIAAGSTASTMTSDNLSETYEMSVEITDTQLGPVVLSLKV